MPFTLRNIKEDLEDIGSRFDGAPDLEFRAATKALELEKSALSYQRVPPGYRFPYGHTHEKQEEVYVVLRGSGRMKSTTRSSSSRNGTRCASRRVRGEATRPGQRASRSSSSARPISARIRAKTSMASATGGLTSGVVRTFDRHRRSATQALDIEAVTLACASVPAMTPEEVRLDLAGPMSSRRFVGLHCACVRSRVRCGRSRPPRKES